MPAMRKLRIISFVFIALTFFSFAPVPGRSQAALLLEEPYGFFGTLNPTGHNAVYFERICAETPTRLRRCQPREPGAVIARYQGIGGYDWAAVPLVPYLYSVEDSADAPARVDRDTVRRLREHYHESHLLGLGADLSAGSFVRGGWDQLVGVSYERRIYAFRFETTEEQDDAFIARMNDAENRSRFNLLFNNCSDFARLILDFYFPRTFHRSLFPDAGITTPKQITYKLVRHARKHPETQLAVFEIPQIPGLRRQSHANKSIAESLSTTGYAVPIAFVNPYLAGGLFVDYIVHGRFHVIPKHPQMLGPDDLSELTLPGPQTENPESAGVQAPSAAADATAEMSAPITANSGLKEIKVPNE